MTTSSETIRGAPPSAALVRVFDLLHHVFLLLIVAWRPLIACSVLAGGQAEIDTVYWRFLPALGLLFCLLESAAGLRRRWRWGTAGVLGVLLLAAVVPAALRSHMPAMAVNHWLEWWSLLLLAAYLMQVLPGRRRFVFALLAGTLAVHCSLAVMQDLVVLPVLQDRVETGELLSERGPAFQAALEHRIAHGGVYATFTLANGLAVFLCMTAVPLAGSLWASRGRPLIATIPAALLLGATVWAYLLTGAKGALLAMAGALLWTAAGRLPRGLGWPLRAAGLVGALLLFFLVPAHLADSLAVRRGYAEAAVGLIREAPLLGHGWKAFMREGARFLPLGQEFSQHAHNAILEMAVSAGIPVALVLAVLLATWMVRPRHMRGPDLDPEPRQRRQGLILLAFPLVLVYGLSLGTLVSDNLGFYPGVDAHPAGIFLWALALGLPGVLAASAVYRLDPPPTWAALVGVGTFCLGCLIDFHLREGALVGSAVVLACLATAHRIPSAWDLTVRRSALVLGFLLVVLTVGVDLLHMHRRCRIRSARRRLEVLARTRDPDRAERERAWVRLSSLDPRLSAEDLVRSPSLRRPIFDGILQPAYALCASWPADTVLWTRCLELDPDRERAWRQANAMLVADLHDQRVLERAAELALARDDPLVCTELSGRAVALHPQNMVLRTRHIRRLKRALDRVEGRDAELLRAELELHRDHLRAHNHEAHFRVRASREEYETALSDGA